jgi:hypothetical protein
MAANRVLLVMLAMLSLVTLPIQLVTTFVLGLVVSITFGLLLVPISLVWFVLLGPLLGLSWMCHRVPCLRNVVGFLALPWAVIACEYVCLMPSMGELENRAAKILICETWPYSWAFWRLWTGRLGLRPVESDELIEVLGRASRKDALKQRTVNRIIAGEELDPGL